MTSPEGLVNKNELATKSLSGFVRSKDGIWEVFCTGMEGPSVEHVRENKINVLYVLQKSIVNCFSLPFFLYDFSQPAALKTERHV